MLKIGGGTGCLSENRFTDFGRTLQKADDMAIQTIYKEAEGELFGQSKMWGCADLPRGCMYPEVKWVDEDGNGLLRGS